jgi:ABC-type molybdate transport system substrate-binding protein
MSEQNRTLSIVILSIVAAVFIGLLAGELLTLWYCLTEPGAIQAVRVCSDGSIRQMALELIAAAAALLGIQQLRRS